MVGLFASFILRRLCVGLCLTFLLHAHCNAAPQAESGTLTEKQIKLGFISNFAVLTIWPSSIGSTLNLCVIGDDIFGLAAETLNGKTIGTRRLVLRSLSAEKMDDGCQIIFISLAGEKIAPSLLAKLRYKPTLTIADWPEALYKGVMVNLIPDGNRLTFEVNLEPVRVAGLGFSSRLLRVANRVLP